MRAEGAGAIHIPPIFNSLATNGSKSSALTPQDFLAFGIVNVFAALSANSFAQRIGLESCPRRAMPNRAGVIVSLRPSPRSTLLDRVVDSVVDTGGPGSRA